MPWRTETHGRENQCDRTKLLVPREMSSKTEISILTWKDMMGFEVQ